MTMEVILSKGVFYNKKDKTYIASIQFQKKSIDLRSKRTLLEAGELRKQAEDKREVYERDFDEGVRE